MLPASLGPTDPLQLPDVRRPEQMPSLPEWAGSRIASLRDESQRDQTGKWRLVPTVPTQMILKASEREAIEQHVIALDRLCAHTPANSPAAQAAMLVVVTTMMLVLPTTTQNELSAEVRGEAFLGALDDLTVWAVEAAIGKWHRGDCGRDNQGRPYAYHWCPAPAELRCIAFGQMWCIRSRSRDLHRLLGAEPRNEYSDEHSRAMRERLAALLQTSRTSLVGRNGSGEVSAKEPAEVPTVGRGEGTARPKA
jgi:hypothetical protein